MNRGRLSSEKDLGSEALGECQKHLKEMTVQLEVYAIDYQGSYPKDWDTMIPGYIKTRPKCPVDDQSFYHLERSKVALNESNPNFDFYEISCNSPHHRKTPFIDNLKGPGERERLKNWGF